MTNDEWGMGKFGEGLLALGGGVFLFVLGLLFFPDFYWRNEELVVWADVDEPGVVAYHEWVVWWQGLG